MIFCRGSVLWKLSYSDIFVEEEVVIIPLSEAGVAYIWPRTLTALMTCLSSLYRIYPPGFVMPKDNRGSLKIKSRCSAINSSTLSYPKYYICSASNITLLFKIVSRKFQL